MRSTRNQGSHPLEPRKGFEAPSTKVIDITETRKATRGTKKARPVNTAREDRDAKEVACSYANDDNAADHWRRDSPP